MILPIASDSFYASFLVRWSVHEPAGISRERGAVKLFLMR